MVVVAVLPVGGGIKECGCRDDQLSLSRILIVIKLRSNLPVLLVVLVLLSMYVGDKS